SFSSQYGQFALSSLPRVGAPAPTPAPPQPEPMQPAPAPQPQWQEPAPAAPVQTGGEDVLGTIERLASLRDAGALSDDEFQAKKSDLLARL
ncbi:MAG: SHOCT domain-containing protein, partial [Pseudomonadota bacterium]